MQSGKERERERERGRHADYIESGKNKVVYYTKKMIQYTVIFLN